MAATHDIKELCHSLTTELNKTYSRSSWISDKYTVFPPFSLGNFQTFASWRAQTSGLNGGSWKREGGPLTHCSHTRFIFHYISGLSSALQQLFAVLPIIKIVAKISSSFACNGHMNQTEGGPLTHCTYNRFIRSHISGPSRNYF